MRLNLVLGWGAVLLYEAPQAVLDDAGEECDPPRNQDQLNESKNRVEGKKQDTEDQRDQQQEQPQADQEKADQEKADQE